MPLSEHEQRLLEEMERNLYGSTSDVHAAEKGSRPHYRSLALGLIVAVVGLAVLIVAVMTQLIILGVVGFVAMFLGVLLATRRDHGSESVQAESSGKTTRPSRPSFMQRMEQRWDDQGEGRL